MSKSLLKRAMEIQENAELGIIKDEKDYAFTFIYPPSRVLYNLKDNPYENKDIVSANLYIHIPYCTGRCTYCYFGCYCLTSAPVEKNVYINKVCKEMEMISSKSGKIELLSIHFGGGTPTTLNDKEIEQIFDSIRKFFIFEDGIEITFESSPETITKDKLKILMNNGVNRLNIGVQTLNDQLLRSINRRHDSKKALEGILIAQELGINNINVDLMYGLQGQTMDDWIGTLNTIFIFNLQSISTYRLRIHPKGKISNHIYTFNEQKAIEMYIAMMDLMEEHQYYQCSSHKFAIKEELAQKQIINKRGIGKNVLIPLGMAAYGYVGDYLFWNERTIEKYIEKIDNNIFPYSIGYKLDKSENIAKSCVLGIHNVNGINLRQYCEKFGEDIHDRYGELIVALQKQDLIEVTEDSLKPSKLGMIFADEIATKFYSDNVKKNLNADNKKYGIFFEQILD